jgi:hypothetical protein
MFGNAASYPSTSDPSMGADPASNMDMNATSGTTDLSDWTLDPPPSEKALDLVFVSTSTNKTDNWHSARHIYVHFYLHC